MTPTTQELKSAVARLKAENEELRIKLQFEEQDADFKKNKIAELEKENEELRKEKQLWSHTAQFRRVELQQQRIAELEAIVEHEKRRADDLHGRRIAELESALKRAEGVPSVEEIVKILEDGQLWRKDRYKPGEFSPINNNDLAKQIHALLTTRRGEK